MRPEDGWTKERKVSLRKLAHTSLFISAFKLVCNALYDSFAPQNTPAAQRNFPIVIRVPKPTRNPSGLIAPNLPLFGSYTSSI